MQRPGAAEAGSHGCLGSGCSGDRRAWGSRAFCLRSFSEPPHSPQAVPRLPGQHHPPDAGALRAHPALELPPLSSQPRLRCGQRLTGCLAEPSFLPKSRFPATPLWVSSSPVITNQTCDSNTPSNLNSHLCANAMNLKKGKSPGLDGWQDKLGTAYFVQIFLFLILFLWLHLWHTEVPGLRIESQLQQRPTLWVSPTLQMQ